MEAYLALIITFCTLSTSLAATAFGPATVHQSNPNECYVDGDSKYYRPGQSWQLGGCAMATCNWSNYSGTPQLMLSYESCGVSHADPPCHIVEDMSLSYPECCPRAICPEEEITSESEAEPEGQLPNSDESDGHMAMVSDSTEMEDSSQKSSSKSSEVNSDDSVVKTKPTEEGAPEKELDDTVDIVADPKHYDYYDGEDGGQGQNHATLLATHKFTFPLEDETYNTIESNDLGLFADSDLRNSEIYDFIFQNRKVSPRFHYLGTMDSKPYSWM